MNPSAVSSTEPTDMYLILLSYAETFKAEINDILANEKIKLCSNQKFTKILQNVNFRIAFANSRNIKKMVIRTKI